MEVSDCSPVPYSLSDIQLPASPECHEKSKDTKYEEKDKVDHVSDEETNEKAHSDPKNKSNEEMGHKLSSSQEDMSESETKDSSYSNESPEKKKVTKGKRHSDMSSDDESDRNSSPYKKKSTEKKKVIKDEKHSDMSSDYEPDRNSSPYKKKSTDKKKVTKDKRHSDMSSDDESDRNSSPYKKKSTDKKKVTKDKRHSDLSSDDESDRNISPYKKKSFKHDDTPSNLGADSDNDHPKNTLSKKQKYIKSEHDADESDNEKKCTDSENYDHHVDSKHKSCDKHRKRDSRSSSSSSSRSRSSDSSAERKHSKKPVLVKSKDFAQEDEGNQMSDKSSDEKRLKHKKDTTTKSPTDSNASVKKRFKIDRDNIPLELSSTKSAKISTVETSSSNKSIEKKTSSQSAPDKPIKEEVIEKKEVKLEINHKPRKAVITNRKLNRNSSEDNSIEPRMKDIKWNYFSASQKSSDNMQRVSANSLKDWFPDFKFFTETPMEVEQDEHSLSAIDEKNSDSAPGDTLNENDSSMRRRSTSKIDMEDSESQEPKFNDTAELGPVSKIIFIQNLVRPFTLNLLKQLLKQSGKIVEEYFWIDKIKSKCFVMYETEKEAIKARNALNNTRWPASNPKILSVEFSSIEELEKHQKGNEPQPLKPPEPPAVEHSDTLEARISHTVEEHKRKDRERRKEKDRAKLQVPVREWDKDKIIQDSPERERPPKEEKPRSSEKKEKKESKKRATEDTPAKLLDDLFQKTKSVPCIYWLPLTEEQAKVKQEERNMRKLERERRNQQQREQEEAERRSRRARSSSRRKEKENRKSSTRSRSPVSRRR